MSDRPFGIQDCTFHVEWSDEDNEWVGCVTEFPSLSFLHPDPARALWGIAGVTMGVLADLAEEASAE